MPTMLSKDDRMNHCTVGTTCSCLHALLPYF